MFVTPMQIPTQANPPGHAVGDTARVRSSNETTGPDLEATRQVPTPRDGGKPTRRERTSMSNKTADALFFIAVAVLVIGALWLTIVITTRRRR
jgi:hypothetical protein